MAHRANPLNPPVPRSPRTWVGAPILVLQLAVAAANAFVLVENGLRDSDESRMRDPRSIAAVGRFADLVEHERLDNRHHEFHLGVPLG